MSHLLSSMLFTRRYFSNHFWRNDKRFITSHYHGRSCLVISQKKYLSSTSDYTTAKIQTDLKKKKYPLGLSGAVYYAKYPNEYYQNKFATKDEHKITFKHQSDLPDLPIPSLEKTLTKYLETIKPFVSSNEEWFQQIDLVKDFEKNEGPILQKKLLKYKNNCVSSINNNNWLNEFWDNQGYLQYDAPIVPYVSYFYCHKPLPHKLIENNMLFKATLLIENVLEFVSKNQFEKIQPNPTKFIGKLCNNSFHMMFNNCRVPYKNGEMNQDSNVFHSIFENGFIIVCYKGNFYKINVYDHLNNTFVKRHEIFYQLMNIISTGTCDATNQTSGIGSLTYLARNIWRKAYAELTQNNPINKNSLEEIQKSMFVVCLDESNEPVTLEEKSRNSWHGDGINRFNDKPLQFIVCKNGTSGCLAEHSKMDGMPTLLLNEYIWKKMSKDIDNEVNYIEDLVKYHNDNNLSIYKENTQPVKLPFMITPNIQKYIDLGKQTFDKNVSEHDLKVWHYNRFGKKIIKQNWKISPDSFIQQVIQLAIYKLVGRQLPTYEAASTRKFFKGRTETIRSVTPESHEFVKTWCQSTSTHQEKLDSLHKSINSHSEYSKLSSNGQGIDRHFFGLKNMIDDGSQVPKLFQDSLFNYSSTWYVSTSQLSSECFEGYGWSEVDDNGVGLAYMINEDWLHINIVTKPLKSKIDVNKLHYYLSESANELFEILNKI
ncbi:related to Carnitine O-acetyltransferase, mitochondrial [Saccharomycodes ludwigii]|uniref:Related to Carnitine O-acetyltransferase, mitochondrial n=1 Tax=Saccharomycodes ludwigii TaxID=36035 RepID=A0A376BA00_9ASCO|nr:related to Carnitine O-acetyltransferase, mitochondrial [Saccharomycodes ludwigii]